MIPSEKYYNLQSCWITLYCRNNFYQSLDSCANQCKKKKQVVKRFLTCCSFEWSKKEQRCRLHTSCPTDAPRNKDFLTCRKEGQSIFQNNYLTQLAWECQKHLPYKAFQSPVSLLSQRGCPIVHCPKKSWTLDIVQQSLGREGSCCWARKGQTFDILQFEGPIL